MVITVRPNQFRSGLYNRMVEAKDVAALVEQVLQPVRREAQSGSIYGFALTLGVFFEFSFEDVVDLLLNRRQLGFVASMPDAISQGIEGAKRILGRGLNPINFHAAARIEVSVPSNIDP